MSVASKQCFSPVFSLTRHQVKIKISCARRQDRRTEDSACAKATQEQTKKIFDPRKRREASCKGRRTEGERNASTRAGEEEILNNRNTFRWQTFRHTYR